jgi:hypothetical protein
MEPILNALGSFKRWKREYVVLALCAGTMPGLGPAARAQESRFHILSISTYSFSPDPSTLPGFPTITVDDTTLTSAGWQNGVFVTPKSGGGATLPSTVVYFPWKVLNGGTTWKQEIENAIPHSIILSYDASAGATGFSNSSHWSYFDLSTLNWQGKGTLPNVPESYTGGTAAGNIVYLSPDGTNPYPVFIAYDSSQPLTSPGAYQTFVPPPPGPSNPLGEQYGWCGAVYDGKFIYYVPSVIIEYGLSGNIYRYDPTQAFSDLSSWSSFNMGTSVSPDAVGFQSGVYDGHRFLYFVPFHPSANLIVRYDTWGGGSGPNPAAFSNPASYTTLDPALLGTSGYPAISGVGNVAQLVGFTGAAVAWDSAQQNEYLYLVPWATFPDDSSDPVLGSTTARVRVGTQSSSGWKYVDFTSLSTSPAEDPDWEIYELTQLTRNPAWPSTWETVFQPSDPLYEFVGPQSTVAGYQIPFVAPASSSSLSLVGFVADTSQFLVEHNVDMSLSNPAAWYVAQVPAGYVGGTMGGGYDAVHQVLYPSAPSDPLFSVQFTQPSPQ